MAGHRSRNREAAFATLEAARTADHAARESALHAAVAEELNLRTAAVKAAFEANHPARRGAKRRLSARGRAPRRPVAACYD